MDTSFSQSILDTFFHRKDVYSTQWSDPEKGVGYRKITTGVCPEHPPCPKRSCPHITTVPISVAVIEKHLAGDETLGSFQLAEDNTVTWACIDIDIAKRAEGNDLEDRVRKQTTQVALVLNSLLGPKTFRVEYSGSRGYHVWIFFASSIQARYALSLLDYIDHAVEPIDGITLELFPKQTALKSYGNLVKIPFGVHKKTGKRCLFVDGYFNPFPDQWKALQETIRVSEGTLTTLIKKHNMEIVPSIRIEPNGDNNKVGNTGLPCYTRAMAEGFGEGMRDLGMFKVAYFLKDRGLPEELTLAAMTELNKKNVPRMSKDVIELKVESAYAGDYGVAPCALPEFDNFCSSRCRFWDSKVRERWTNRGRSLGTARGKISRD